MSDAHMTFGFSEEQRQMRASVLGFCAACCRQPRSRARQGGEYPFEACKALADGGYMGLMYPPEYGGMGGSYMDLAVLGEALGYHYGGIAQAYGITVIYAGMHIALHGCDAMKREVLPKIISGDMRLALCLSEPTTAPTLPASSWLPCATAMPTFSTARRSTTARRMSRTTWSS
jgi:alkylation response protein AidB-like acyl-CoA dehydrogenase